MTKLNLFFSWQSDIAYIKTNISDKIKNAIREFNQEQTDYEVVYTTDNRGDAQHDKIEDNVLANIKNAEIFVADLTPLICYRKQKYLLNPNVLIELGFAMRQMNMGKQIVLVANTHENMPEIDIAKLPFDINHNSINLNPNTNYFKCRIREYIKYLRQNGSQQVERNVINHDTQIFQKFDAEINQVVVDEMIEWIGSNLKVSTWWYDKMDFIINWNHEIKNHFLDSELQNLINDFTASIQECKTFLALHTSPSYHTWHEDQENMSKHEIEHCKRFQWYVWDNHDLSPEQHDRIYLVMSTQLPPILDRCIDTYYKFRTMIKNTLYL